ncbi:ENTH domain-containing protein [Smittium mucronatum]|uniref:ENTH domain-containing protein n=1 Tax=Smittium mucronatum TaxID=133383 RepID=A0A1R0H0J7_9FUNG|nr:ENTH domain-containing protein [Smittium mucronatum]
MVFWIFFDSKLYIFSEDLNRIMALLYAKFEESDPSSWRQIYKALQLLEYLLKNGSENVIDDARRQESIIRALRNFHYKDKDDVDRGLNGDTFYSTYFLFFFSQRLLFKKIVRVLSAKICDLLNDTPKLKEERKKAKINRNKYKGTGSNTPTSSTSDDYRSSSQPAPRSRPSPSKTSRNDRNSQTNNIPNKNYLNGTNSVTSKNNESGRRIRPVEPKNEVKKHDIVDEVKDTLQIGDLLSFDDIIDVPSHSAPIISEKPKPIDHGIESLIEVDDFSNDWGEFQSSAAPPTGGLNLDSDVKTENLLFSFDSVKVSNTVVQPNSMTNPINDISPSLKLDSFPLVVSTKSDNISKDKVSTTSATEFISVQDPPEPAKKDNDIWEMHKSLISLDSLFPSKN